MKKSMIAFLIVLAGAGILFLGCGDGGTKYTITVVNNSDATFTDLNIVDQASDVWGDDLLPADTAFTPGESVTVTAVLTTPDDISVRAKYDFLGLTYSARGDHLSASKTISIRGSITAYSNTTTITNVN
jgi:hypothetical protein